MKIKKIISLLLVLVFLSTYLPIIANISLAATAIDYDFTNELEKDRIGIGFTWTASTRTLVITGIKNDEANIFLPSDSTIDIQGENQNYIQFIIVKGANLTIKGNETASLSLKGKAATYDTMYNSGGQTISQAASILMEEKGTFTLESGNLNISPGKSLSATFEYGIDCTDSGRVSGNIIINGGNLNIDNVFVGIDSQNLTINGGNVNINSKFNSIRSNYLIINNGNIIANNEGSAYPYKDYCTLYTGYAIESNVTMKKGTLEITASSGDSQYAADKYGAFKYVPNIDPTYSCKIKYNLDTTLAKDAVEGDLTDLYNTYNAHYFKLYPNYPTTSLNVSVPKNEILVNEEVPITIEREPEDCTDMLVYKSESEDIAKVSENGVITGVSRGKTNIIIESGKINRTIEIKVLNQVVFDYGVLSNTIEKLTSINGKIEELPVATMDGYEFLGWFTEETGGEQITTDTVFEENTTVYAHWKLIKDKTIVFDANEGTCTVSSIDTDAKIEELPVATRDGYEFLGWFTEATGGEQITTDTVFEENTTVYAHWKLIKDKTIVFDANEGTCTVSSIDTDAKIEELPVATRDGYEFLGWFTEATGGEQITTDTVFEENTTVYAHWKLIKDKTIVFDANEGTCTVSSIDTNAKIEELPVATRDGYEFLGWFTEKTGGEQITVDTVFKESTTVYAHWKKKLEPIIIGDINLDNKINIKDWNILYAYINETYEFNEIEFTRADINRDGKVNVKDWNRLYEHINEVEPLY